MQSCSLFDADVLVFELPDDVLGPLICKKFHLFLECWIEFGVVVPHSRKVRDGFLSVERVHRIIPKFAEGVDSLELVLAHLGDGIFVRFVVKFF